MKGLAISPANRLLATPLPHKEPVNNLEGKGGSIFGVYGTPIDLSPKSQGLQERPMWQVD